MQTNFRTIIFVIPLCVFMVCLSATVHHQPRHHSQAKVIRSRQIGTQGQILSRMFTGEYDPFTRPPVRDSADHSAIAVITSIYINRIVWNKQLADVDLYLNQQWEDSRLAYDVDIREGIDEVIVPKNRKIWDPDTIFVGQGRSPPTNEDDHSTLIIVEPSGFVRYRERKNIIAVAKTDDAFPVSNQKWFRLTISSNSYPIEDVIYLWANSPPTVLPIEVSDELYNDDAEFTFQHAQASDCVGNYTIGAFGCIQIEAHFQGRSSSGWFQVIIPCIILVFASWLHFWVMGTWSVPRSISASVPFFIFICLLLFNRMETCALRVWLIVCTIFTFFSLFEYFLVIGLSNLIRTTPTVTVIQQPATVVTTTDHGYTQQSKTLLLENEEPATIEIAPKKLRGMDPLAIDRVSRIAFPMAFLIFFIIFMVLFLIIG